MNNDKPRLLLVEDHADTAAALAKTLEISGYDVQTASSYHRAMKLGMSQPFDLLLVDLGLPDGDGKDLLRELMEHHRPVKAIAISGYAMSEDVQQCKEAGFAAHIAKPHTAQALLDVVRRVLDER